MVSRFPLPDRISAGHHCPKETLLIVASNSPNLL
jgi:hypothetical protein